MAKTSSTISVSINLREEEPAMLSSSPATCPHENHEWVDNLARPHVREGTEHTHNFTPGFAERKRAEHNVGFVDSPFSARIYRELRQADKCKDEFLATVVHELRASLAPIR